MKPLPNRSFRKIWRNVAPKVVCLILGILAWLWVMDNLNPGMERVFHDMNVEIVGKEQVENKGLIIGSIENATVDVTVSGLWRNIMGMNKDDIVLSAQITGDQKGPISVPINYEIKTPNLRITDLSARYLKVNLDQIEDQDKTLKLVIQGELPQGVELGDLAPDASTIKVRGASEVLKTIAYVEGVVDLSGHTASFETNIDKEQLIPKNAKGEVVADVQVTAPVLNVEVPFIVQKALPVRVFYKELASPKYKLTSVNVKPENVRVEGQDIALERLVEIPTKEIDISGYTTPAELEAELIIPEGFKLISAKVVTVNFEITAVETRSFTFKAGDISFTNTNDELSYAISPTLTSVTVEISDTRAVLSEIQQKDLKLTVNVKDMTEGLWNPALEVTGFPKGSVVRVLPDTVSLEVTPRSAP